MAVNPNLEGALERVKAIQEKRAAKQAEEKARWDFYHEQLAKATPHQGGAHARKTRAYRLWPWNDAG